MVCRVPHQNSADRRDETARRRHRRGSHRISLALAGLLASGAASITEATASGLALPHPGTYTLNRIQRVPFAIVLETNYIPRPLSRYTRNAITLLSFFYTRCVDPQGCPRAWETFETVRLAIENRADLHGKTRLVSLSLDPRYDTPELLRMFARTTPTDLKVVPWHFLTTYSPIFLHRLLRDMGEEISIDREASARGGFVLNHLLKAFLVDKQGWVREIYSNATLDPETILGDIETLILEDSNPAERH